MRFVLLVFAATTTLAHNVKVLYPRGHNATITTPGPTGGSEPTITVTDISTLTVCPHKTKCHGQTVTWTGTAGPVPCSASITCTCVLPTAPPVLPTCPANVTCTGQTTTWTSTAGPSSCNGVCTVELPSDTGRTGPSPTTSPPAFVNEAGGMAGGVEKVAGALMAAGAALLL